MVQRDGKHNTFLMFNRTLGSSEEFFFFFVNERRNSAGARDGMEGGIHLGI